jgi:hypothetical protein
MSAGLTAGAGLMQGVGQYEAGQSRSQLYRANASIAGQQAQSEAQAGATNEEMQRMKGTAFTGQQVAQIGASNLQQAGTSAQVVANSAEINEMNALQTRNNALRKSWGFQVQEASDSFQSKEASTAGDFSAAGSILTGGAKAASQYNSTGSFF